MKPESNYTMGVNKHLKGRIHVEKMHNPYRGGTFDFWYSGDQADLWVEYKFTTRKTGVVVPELSPLQLKWGTDRYNEGRRVVVVIGSKDGAVILDNPVLWAAGEHIDDFQHSKQSVASWIHLVATGEVIIDSKATGKSSAGKRIHL